MLVILVVAVCVLRNVYSYTLAVWKMVTVLYQGYFTYLHASSFINYHSKFNTYNVMQQYTSF